MKKILPIILIVVSVLGLLIFLIVRNKSKGKEITVEEPKTTLIETPLGERPFVALIPGSDGKRLNLQIGNILHAQTIEYELTYLSRGLSRGVIGTINPKGESDFERELLLGSCSKNTCVYDEGVESGLLTLRFRDGQEIRKFSSNFTLTLGGQKLASADGKFSIEKKFNPKAYYLVMPTIGLPANITSGEAVSDSYGVFSSDTLSISGATAKIVSDGVDETQLLGFNGKTWEIQKSGLSLPETAVFLLSK